MQRSIHQGQGRSDRVKKIAIIAFTQRGCELACRLDALLCTQAREQGEDDFAVSVAGPERYAAEFDIDAYESLDTWTREAFTSSDALVFVSATGIAVRAIALYVRDKFCDPAVVSIDERAQFVVPLLSGHVGGANDLARDIAQLVGAQAVVSTATDVNGLFAVDQWAREQGLVVCERETAKHISAVLLAGEPVCFASDFPVEGVLPAGIVQAKEGALGFYVTLDEGKSPFDETLHLVPRIVTVGAGCHRDQPAADLEACIGQALVAAGVSPRAVSTLASIDLKAKEPAFAQVAGKFGWQLRFYSADELNAVPGDFVASEFVRKITGTDNVCERAALAGGGTLLQEKMKAEGTTAAVALQTDFAVRFMDWGQSPKL